MTAFEIEGFQLHGWQREAVAAWVRGDDSGAYRGTLEIVTGGGKTLIALECMAEAARVDPEVRLAVVVPTEALARQWLAVLEKYTTLHRGDLALIGAGGHGSLSESKAVVAVLNSAAKKLPMMARSAQPLMLVVDECHRAGAPTFARVLDTPARFRLGLSATPDREEFDEAGEPLTYDEQRVGRSLGSVVYSFSLRDARQMGWLPDYEIHHHGLQLHPAERQDYESISRRVDDLADQLRRQGFESARAQQLSSRQDDVGHTARSYVAVTAQRKDLLYRAKERERVAARLVGEALSGGRQRRILLFHERVDEAIALYQSLSAVLPPSMVALEHSRLGTGERSRAVAAFRSGDAQVLVSVKSLIEGLDVPEADIGMSVASSSSIRQRVQSLGRVLRRQFDANGPTKHAEMHLLYVAETVDELIYAKEDWADLTGAGANHYWLWPPDPDLGPEPTEGPPASPRPTEDQEWERLGGKPPAEPALWLGTAVGQEYSIDTMGTVRNSFGTIIANAQDVDRMVEAVRGRPGGRFRVTPQHRLVLVWGDSADGPELLVAGQLAEPFRALEEPAGLDVGLEEVDVSALQPGDRYPGPADSKGGKFKLRQKHGGVIERQASGRTIEYALIEGDGQLEENGRLVLTAWRRLFDRGIPFNLNQVGDAWYVEGGERRFLAHVPGGFAWPTSFDQSSGKE